MKRILLTITAGLISTSAALAEGDVAAGEKAFKKCKSCHAIVDPEGVVIVKGGKVGPNLWGVIGRTAGTYEGFRYGKSLVQAGENGLVWTQELLVSYIADPKEFLREYLDDPAAKSKMTFRQKDGDDIGAYLASLSPAAQEGEEEASEEGESN